ncbi:MBL fold metallo-hydrolase [Aeromonas caviae]|uniref:MBL fold metallo-hydrolase n=1 Tax=Aeromonas caviae TaxID=648 RepID=A0A3S5WWP9_AERCA|nr:MULTISPECIES: MBL fold metallo-hydrolase [Aeromonas]PZQ98766.1 MAG: MBL fold metallo-hydrolase [Aeromonas media]AXB05268.1 MBL fold metallo-hydrolase [Aeromonas caviae]AXB09896.1 MBL fold metallo-hydrolase [Aeromonas caviae]MBL0437825.1 MBL fold metallo-hydrolase [Aeromonas caviae]MBL0664390.1 MBL fold metallo-hydrolase [Aeromonas caviae]
MLTFSVLVDDDVHLPGCLPEKGLSLLLECDGLKVLFDSGRGRALRHNAEVMGVDLGSLTHVVLSHGHYDHVGGIGSLPVYSDPIPLIACPDVFNERGYFLPLLPRRYNLYRLSGDLDPRQLATRGLLPHCSAEPVWLSERLVFLGSILRREQAKPSLLGYMVRGGRVEKDLISDDSALVYKSEQGLIVFIGCGHAGAENIIARAKEVCGDERIHAVIGGLHLKFSGPQRAVALGTYLQEEAVEKLFACHCTGKRKAVLPRQRQIGAGFEYRFPA